MLVLWRTSVLTSTTLTLPALSCGSLAYFLCGAEGTLFALLLPLLLSEKHKAGGTADPLLILVVIHTHHGAAAEPDQGSRCLQAAPVGHT